jgi:hypothetical protein
VQFAKKNSGRHGQNARFWDLRLKKSYTKHKIWTTWTHIFESMDQYVAGSIHISHPKKWDFSKEKSFFVMA